MIPYKDSHRAHIRPTRCHPAIIRWHLVICQRVCMIQSVNAMHCTVVYKASCGTIWWVIHYFTMCCTVTYDTSYGTIQHIVWCPYDSSYGTTRHIIVQSHRTQYHMMHRMVQYDASNSTVWCIGSYDALYGTERRVIRCVIWFCTIVLRMVPYGVSYGTVPYNYVYGILQCILQIHHTVRYTIQYRIMMCHTVLFDASYGTVWCIILWDCTMMCCVVPYDESYGHHTMCHMVPYDVSYVMVQHIVQ